METHEKIGVKIQPELAKAIEEMGYTEFTDIQNKSIPLIQEGKDVIGQSFTGSGKTAAFGLPMLEKTIHGNGLQSLVLVPTRELCEQVTTELRKFSKHKRMHITSVYGGVSINPQIMNLRHADIVVATPGRFLDHMQRGTINLSKVKILVLDEADKMFEMGFIDDIRKIISQLPHERQTLLFSATMSQEVQEIVKHYMKSPVKIKVQEYVDKGKLTQYYYSVPSRDKFSLLVNILKHQKPELTMIFCATRNRVDFIGKNLYKQNIRSVTIHGGLSQNKRKQSLDMFHGGQSNILVASDVAARGLDIKNVSHIINYDIPKTSKDYIHRIGRTARAGEEGKVISLLSEQDHDNMRSVLGDRSITIEQLPLPEFEKVQVVAAERSQGFQGRGSFGQGRSYGSQGRSYGQRPSHGRSEGSYHGRSSGAGRGYGGSDSNRSTGSGSGRGGYGSHSGSSHGGSSGRSQGSRGHFGHGRSN